MGKVLYTAGVALSLPLRISVSSKGLCVGVRLESWEQLCQLLDLGMYQKYLCGVRGTPLQMLEYLTFFYCRGITTH